MHTNVEGIWDLSVATPIGRIEAVAEFRREADALTGIAYGTGEEVPLHEVVLD